jgi:hypothetical protein
VENNPSAPHAQDHADRIVSAFLDVVADALQRRLDGDLASLREVRCTLTAQMRDEVSAIEMQVRSELCTD